MFILNNNGPNIESRWTPNIHSWKRVLNLPILWGLALYCLPLLFSNFDPPPYTHTHTHTHTPTHTHTNTQTHTQTHKHTARTGANRLTHPYNILTPPVLCSQQLSVLHWMNNSIIIINNSKIYFTEFHNGFAFWKFLLICWLNSVRLSSSNETQRILIDMVTVNTTRPPPPPHLVLWENFENPALSLF